MVISLEDFKQYLWYSEDDKDDLLQSLIDWAIGIVEAYIGRGIEAKDYDELVSGKGQLSLVMKNYPINGVSDISINRGTQQAPVWATVSNNSYIFNEDTGIIEFYGRMNRGLKNYRVKYNAGYNPIPWDLKIAIMKLAWRYYNMIGKEWVKSESVLGDQIVFEDTQISSDVMIILQSYVWL